MIETPEDKTKFELLYEEYRGLMYYVAYKILNNDADAEDAVSSAFVKVAENIKKVEEPISPRTKRYLVTIVENRAIDVKRVRSHHVEVPYDEDTVGIQYEYEGSNGLAKCISKLPVRYQTLLTYKYEYGFTNKEIARLMEISEANVRQTEKRAKEKLQQICAEEGLFNDYYRCNAQECNC